VKSPFPLWQRGMKEGFVAGACLLVRQGACSEMAKQALLQINPP